MVATFQRFSRELTFINLVLIAQSGNGCVIILLIFLFNFRFSSGVFPSFGQRQGELGNNLLDFGLRQFRHAFLTVTETLTSLVSF